MRERRPQICCVRQLAAGLLLTVLLPGVTVASGGWRCEADMATAYRRDPVTGGWDTLIIPVGDQRFLVRPGSRPGRWELVWEGNAGPALPCTDDVDMAGLLRCGPDAPFEMDRKRLTFTSHLFGAGTADLDALMATTVTGTCVAL